MKKRIKLSAGITLINKKFKKGEFYHYFEEPDNVIIIPKINNQFVLVNQKREPINKNNYEFPMGWIDKGENSFDAANRELIEETGYKSLKKPQKISEFYADPGRGSRKCICYYSKNLLLVGKGERNIKVFFKTKKEILKMINLKQFNNSSHIAAFFFFINKF